MKTAKISIVVCGLISSISAQCGLVENARANSRFPAGALCCDHMTQLPADLVITILHGTRFEAVRSGIDKMFEVHID